VGLTSCVAKSRGVDSVPFSFEHLSQAQETVSKASLYLGVVEPDADRRQEIAQELQSIVDVPVAVAFEERFTECVG
jgi:hypothetical protein